jgi:hypothetical protein
MYPAQSREAKAREAAVQRHEADNQRRKQALIADLKALNRRIDERMKRESKSRS